ncbi:proton-conducting transporter transmembrane domain-containing protein [Blastomonas aquatica]|uniref:proton-conducting transporter transmembrane domain-containing protein n=1 Tax=Blastomonas aquatica TaxID=1510276 RepID=UPI00360BC2AB
MRRLIAFNIIGSGIFLLFGASGSARSARIDRSRGAALIITGIVVALAATAFGVGLVLAFAKVTGQTHLPRRVMPGNGRSSRPARPVGSNDRERPSWMNGMLAIVALVTLPLVAALMAVVVERRGEWIALLSVIGVVIALSVLMPLVATDGPVEPRHWRMASAAWDHAARDGLALAFAGMAALVMAAVLVSARTLYGASPSEAETRGQWAFWPLALLLWGALNVAFLSRDLFNLYVALELLTVAAVALVAIEGKRESLAAALRYLMFALMGSLAYLLGAALLYADMGRSTSAYWRHGTSAMHQAQQAVAERLTLWQRA